LSLAGKERKVIMRPFLFIVISTSLAAAICTADLAGKNSSSANLVVALPSDAKLYFDGTPTRQTGTTRTFYTPPLAPGANYTYDLKAEVDRDGELLSQTQRVSVRPGQTTRVDFSTLDAGAAGTAELNDSWPRKVETDRHTVTVYQPQVEKWDGNRLEARAAVAVQTQDSQRPTYGVVSLTARTEVDKEHRLVALEDVQVTRADFSSAPDRAAEYAEAVRQALPHARTISLDRLEANLAVTRAATKTNARL